MVFESIKELQKKRKKIPNDDFEIQKLKILIIY